MLSTWLRFYGSTRGFLLLVSLVAWTTISWQLKIEQSGLHKRDLAFAEAIYSGRLVETPAYPMWGYPLLLGLVDNGVLLLQLAVVVMLLPTMSQQVVAYFKSMNSRLSEFSASLLMFVCLLPWLYLALSYTSSAGLSLMLIAGYMTLLSSEGIAQKWRLFAIAGLCMGLAYNFRTEALIVSLAVIAAMGMAFLSRGLAWKDARAVAIFGTIFSLCVVPYLIYTTFAVGKPLLSTTNGGAVLYDQLGILPNNPWHIEPTDEFAEEQAKSFTDQGAWSLPADQEFKRRFIAAIAAHPRAFAMRAVRGLKENLMMGLMSPRIEELLNMNEREGMKVYLARQELKNAIGFRMNRAEIEHAASMGVEMKDIGPWDRALVLIEFLPRTFYVGLWILLLMAWPIGCYRQGFFSWNSLITSAFLGTLMVISMFIQTGMRPSTTFLPVAVVFALQANVSCFGQRKTLSTTDTFDSPLDMNSIQRAA